MVVRPQGRSPSIKVIGTHLGEATRSQGAGETLATKATVAASTCRVGPTTTSSTLDLLTTAEEAAAATGCTAQKPTKAAATIRKNDRVIIRALAR
jgi:hypothetical protein